MAQGPRGIESDDARLAFPLLRLEIVDGFDNSLGEKIRGVP